jgi:hypothetical protein
MVARGRPARGGSGAVGAAGSSRRGRVSGHAAGASACNRRPRRTPSEDSRLTSPALFSVSLAFRDLSYRTDLPFLLPAGTPSPPRPPRVPLVVVAPPLNTLVPSGKAWPPTRRYPSAIHSQPTDPRQRQAGRGDPRLVIARRRELSRSFRSLFPRLLRPRKRLPCPAHELLQLGDVGLVLISRHSSAWKSVEAEESGPLRLSWA